MRTLGKDRPTPPARALDSAIEYLTPGLVIRRLTQRIATVQGLEGRISLARTAQLLFSEPAGTVTGDLGRAEEKDWSEPIEATEFGPARQLRSSLTIGDASMRWDRSAVKLDIPRRRGTDRSVAGSV